MIPFIPMSKEGQDASETVSLLSKVPYNQSKSAEAEEDLWSFLPESPKQREQRPMEERAS
jgi:hypothetical protein